MEILNDFWNSEWLCKQLDVQFSMPSERGKRDPKAALSDA